MSARWYFLSSWVALLSCCVLAGAASAAPIIVQYTFQGGTCTLTDPTVCTATTTALNTTASTVNNTGSSADLLYSAAPPSSAFVEQLILSTTPADAVANNQYFQFTIAANVGYSLALSDITFDAARGGSSTPRGWVLRSSVDGFAADIATDTVPTVQPTFTGFNTSLAAGAYQGLTSPVTFRIYGFAPGAPGVGILYDNLTVHGNVMMSQPVPIPGALMMLLGGLGALASLAKRASWR